MIGNHTKHILPTHFSKEPKKHPLPPNSNLLKIQYAVKYTDERQKKHLVQARLSWNIIFICVFLFQAN
jgi:hypothetical protein